MDADAEMGLMLADALAAGLAWPGTFTPQSGSPAAVVVSCQDIPENNLEDIGGEISRRQLLVVLQESTLAAAVKRSDSLTIAAGPFAGTWVVISTNARDPGCRTFTVRNDDRVKSRTHGVERMP